MDLLPSTQHLLKKSCNHCLGWAAAKRRAASAAGNVKCSSRDTGVQESRGQSWETRGSPGHQQNLPGQNGNNLLQDEGLTLLWAGCGALRMFPSTSVTDSNINSQGSCIIGGAVASRCVWLHRQQMLSFHLIQSWRAVLFLFCFLGNLFNRFSVPSQLFQCI